MHPGRDAGEDVRFTLVGGGEALDDDGLRRLYAYPDAAYPDAASPDAAEPDSPARLVLRGNAITSLDGGATTGGTSGGLGGAGDRRLFAVLRELADVIIVGAGTARAEGYRGARLSAAARQRRRQRGQSEVPPIALVTRSGVLEHDLPVLADSEVAPMVLTCSENVDGARSRLGGAAEAIDCSAADPTEVDLSVALRRLAERGLLRALTEGGPSLLGSFVAGGLLDELCLTSAPVLVAGPAVRIAAGSEEVLSRMRRAHVMADDDGYLYARYVRGR